MREPFASAIAANRFGLGARPGELASIGADGREWLRAQLRAAPAAIADPQLRPSQEILAQALELRQEIRAGRKSGPDDAAAAALQKLPQFLRPIYLSEASARAGAAARARAHGVSGQHRGAAAARPAAHLEVCRARSPSHRHAA